MTRPRGGVEVAAASEDGVALPLSIIFSTVLGDIIRTRTYVNRSMRVIHLFRQPSYFRVHAHSRSSIATVGLLNDDAWVICGVDLSIADRRWRRLFSTLPPRL